VQQVKFQGGADRGEFLDEAIDGPQGEIVGAFGSTAPSWS
jgi:hypothetical protein